jgi:hypothetical protein
VHQWQISISHNWSILELFYLLQLLCLSSFFICFGSRSFKSTRIITAISRYFKIESHELMNCYMPFVDCLT